MGDTAYFGPEAEFFIFNDVKYDSGSNFAFHEVDSNEGTWNTGKDEGWQKSISGVKKFNDLPEKAKTYIKDIENYLGIPVDIISNGPGREENIIINSFF